MIDNTLIYDVLHTARKIGYLKDDADIEDINEERSAVVDDMYQKLSLLQASVRAGRTDYIKEDIGGILITLIMLADLSDTGIGSCLYGALCDLSKYEEEEDA